MIMASRKRAKIMTVLCKVKQKHFIFHFILTINNFETLVLLQTYAMHFSTVFLKQIDRKSLL